MTSKFQHNWKAVLGDIHEAIKNRDIPEPTIGKCARFAGVPRSSLQNAFYRLCGIIDTKDLVAWSEKPFFVDIDEINDKDKDEGGERVEAEYGDNYINIVCASSRIKTIDDAISEFKIDMSQWTIVRYKVKSSEGYRKDRQVDWLVEDGHVVSGNVKDTGKMLVVPLYHVEVRLERKIEEVHARLAIRDMLEDAKRFAPKYPKLTRKKQGGLLYELAIPDIHFGRLTWREESGADWDVKIAERVVMDAVAGLLQYVQSYDISRILLPIGNDYFNVNSRNNTTANGTPQQEDTRWQKTFRLGRELAVKMIDACSQIAPTDVLVVTGNHAKEKEFYMGDALYCWYHNNPNVSINNNAKTRKYYRFGSVLLGLTHGSEEKLDTLISLMPLEARDMWSQTCFHEWHIGHWHHKKDMMFVADETRGIVVRTLRSLVARDAWTFEKGLVGSQRAAESFLWHPSDGLIGQFTVVVKQEKQQTEDRENL